MPRMVISFAESALRDLEAVRPWYAEQGVPDVGTRLVEEVFQRVQALADHPDMGRVVPEFDVYRRDPQRVRIVRAWRSEHLLHFRDADSETSA